MKAQMKFAVIDFARLPALILLFSMHQSPIFPGPPPVQKRQPFSKRGYYITFMRMPTFGLDSWKRTIDCIESDGGNTLILWMAGGFRSRKFPETWEYNKDHANIKRDFVRKLIDYAHAHRVKILLG